MARRAELQRRGGGMALRRSGATSMNLFEGVGANTTGGAGGGGGKGGVGGAGGGKGAAAGGKGGKGGKAPVRRPVLVIGDAPWARSEGMWPCAGSTASIASTPTPTPTPAPTPPTQRRSIDHDGVTHR